MARLLPVLAAPLLCAGPALAQSAADDTLSVPIVGEVLVPPPGLVLGLNRSIQFGEVFISKNADVLCRYDLKPDGSIVVGTQVKSGRTDTTGIPPGCGVTNAVATHPSELALDCVPGEVVTYTQQRTAGATGVDLLTIAALVRREDGGPLPGAVHTPVQGSFQCPDAGKVLFDIGGALFTTEFAPQGSGRLVGQIALSVTMP